MQSSDDAEDAGEAQPVKTLSAAELRAASAEAAVARFASQQQQVRIPLSA
jgi:hypothetical protein